MYVAKKKDNNNNYMFLLFIIHSYREAVLFITVCFIQ